MTDTNNISENGTVFIIHLLRMGAYLHRMGDRIAGEYGLTQQQFVVLNEIITMGKISQKQLVGELLYEKSNISKIVKKLKSSDLIEILISPKDKRVTILNATNKGKNIWQQVMERFNVWNINWVKPLAKGEMSQRIQILKRLQDVS